VPAAHPHGACEECPGSCQSAESSWYAVCCVRGDRVQE
jgi:hypothetical protein